MIGKLEPIRLCDCDPMFLILLLLFMLGIIQLFCDQAEVATKKYNF